MNFNDKTFSEVKKVEIEANLDVLIQELSTKFQWMYRVWLADAILYDCYDKSLQEFKQACHNICLGYLKEKIQTFDSQLYLEHIIQYLDNLIQNIIDNISEG